MILRIEYARLGPIRFISHRDTARAWERAFRRARLPLAFTQGFSPHPRISFGLALPLGWESEAEYLDVTLSEPLATAEVATRLDAVLPDGMGVVRVAEVPPGSPSAASLVEWADYVVALMRPDEGPAPSAAVMTAAIEKLMALPEWPAPQRKKGREIPNTTEDIRGRVAHLLVSEVPPDPLGPVALTMRLATQPRVIRPDEVCALLSEHDPAAACEARIVRRTAQFLLTPDGRLADLMPAASTPAPEHGRTAPTLLKEDLSLATLPSPT